MVICHIYLLFFKLTMAENLVNLNPGGEHMHWTI